MAAICVSAYAQDCPNIQIEGPAAGWRSTEAPDQCSAEAIFSCKSGQLTALKRVRMGPMDLYQGQCREPEQRTKTREQQLTEEASRQGISLRELERRLTPTREQVEPSPVVPKTPTSKVLTADAPMTTDVAAAGGTLKDLALSEELKAKAKSEGVPEIVLERAFANYKDLLSQGKTKRTCFMAADLTTPDRGQVWILCDTKPVRVIKMPSYYGSGTGANCADDAYKNKDGCAKYFSNKPNSCLPMGGKFVTSVATVGRGSKRSLIELQGLEPFNNNARTRRIGIHRAVLGDGQTPLSAVEGIEASNGCFVLPSDLKEISDLDLSSAQAGLGMSFYVYPSPSDIENLVKGKEAYWNDSCRKQIVNPAWIGKDGDYFYDPKAIEEDQVKFINEYYQEEVPKTEEPAKPTPNVK